jgi:signal transduction histidine kinase
MRANVLPDHQRVHTAMLAAEDGRSRWARDLQDGTLQGLGGLRVLLAAARRSGDPDRLQAAVGEAVGRIDGEIDGLRSLIRELRPAVLDELGPAAAIEGLASRAAERHGIAVTADVGLPAKRFPPELETALFRTVQEALANAVRHARAQRVAISANQGDGVLHVSVRDDGHGFDPGAPTDGYGIAGMRERVALLRGDLEIESSCEGTVVTAELPNP